MKKFLALCSLLVTVMALAATTPSPYLQIDDTLLEPDEVQATESLVAATQVNLERQQRLLDLLKDFRAARADFAEKETKECAAVVIQDAQLIEELIEDAALSSQFRPEFLNEVHLIAQMARRHSITRP